MDVTKELQRFEITDLAISQLASNYMALKIMDINDNPMIAAVSTARKDIKARRVLVEKTGKELRADANAFNQAVLSEEKRIKSLLAPIEQHLIDEEARIEKMRQEAEAKLLAARQKKLDDRKEFLETLGCRFDGVNYQCGGLTLPSPMLEALSDDQFNVVCMKMQEAIAEELAQQEALRAAKEARKAEEQAQKEKIARLEAENAAMMAKIRAEMEEKMAIERAEMEAKMTQLAAEKKISDDLVEAALQAEADRQKKAVEAIKVETDIEQSQEKARAALASLKQHDEATAKQQEDKKAEPVAETPLIVTTDLPAEDHRTIIELASKLEELRFFYEAKMKTGDGQLIMNKAKTQLNALIKYLRKEGIAL